MQLEKADMEQSELKKNVLARMKRIEGQVRGVQRMIEEGKECGDILVQVRAVQSALRSTNKLILRRYMLRCHMTAMENGASQEETLDKFIDVLTNYLDG